MSLEQRINEMIENLEREAARLKADRAAWSRTMGTLTDVRVATLREALETPDEATAVPRGHVAFTIHFPNELLAKVDEVARESSLSRTEVIRAVVEHEFASQE